MNLELYWGPKDGQLIDMPVTVDDNTRQVRRARTVTVGGATYRIDPVAKHPDKKPQEGVTYIGVYLGNR